MGSLHRPGKSGWNQTAFRFAGNRESESSGAAFESCWLGKANEKPDQKADKETLIGCILLNPSGSAACGHANHVRPLTRRADSEDGVDVQLRHKCESMCSRLCLIQVLLLLGAQSEVAQNLGFPPALTLNEADIYSAFGLPPLRDAAGTPAENAASSTQVFKRAQAL